MEKEIWKDVFGLEGLYKVSSLKRIKSLDRFVNHKNGHTKKITGRIKKQWVSHYGYMVVSLYNGNKVCASFVHRIYAQAFIKNPGNLPCINHKDGNKLNNDRSNLEWCTYRENLIHARKTGLVSVTDKMRGAAYLVGKSNAGKEKSNAKCVIDTSSGKEYRSIKYAAKANGINQSLLGMYLRGDVENKTTLRLKTI